MSTTEWMILVALIAVPMAAFLILLGLYNREPKGTQPFKSQRVKPTIELLFYFSSFPLLWAAVRYVERNPVRAGLGSKS